ncbi:MAG: peptidylprolyl isomerase [Pseudonocardiaceae bacterium]|nr:peptidylprolyl isomerase [Pseudonocardiaceae bacterium]
MPTNEQRRQAAKRKLDRQLARRAARAQRRRWYAVAGSAAAVVLVIGLVVLITVLGGDDGSSQAATPPSADPVPSSAVESALPEGPAIPAGRAPAPERPQPLPATVPCQYPPTGRPPAKPVQPPPGGETSTEGTVGVTLQTGVGTIPLTLDRGLAPCAVNSFVSLAEQGFYDDTPCHRLTTSPTLQVLQCGDPSGTGRGGPGYSFADETFPELSYGRGYLAMANSGPDTNGSQFFMIYGSAQLPPDYTVFGTIAPEGLQVIDRVARAGSDNANRPGDGAPNTPVQIKSATVRR